MVRLDQQDENKPWIERHPNISIAGSATVLLIAGEVAKYVLETISQPHAVIFIRVGTALAVGTAAYFGSGAIARRAYPLR